MTDNVSGVMLEIAMNSAILVAVIIGLIVALHYRRHRRSQTDTSRENPPEKSKRDSADNDEQLPDWLDE